MSYIQCPQQRKAENLVKLWGFIDYLLLTFFTSPPMNYVNVFYFTGICYLILIDFYKSDINSNYERENETRSRLSRSREQRSNNANTKQIQLDLGRCLGRLESLDEPYTDLHGYDG